MWRKQQRIWVLACGCGQCCVRAPVHLAGAGKWRRSSPRGRCSWGWMPSQQKPQQMWQRPSSSCITGGNDQMKLQEPLHQHCRDIKRAAHPRCRASRLSAAPRPASGHPPAPANAPPGCQWRRERTLRCEPGVHTLVFGMLMRSGYCVEDVSKITRDSHVSGTTEPGVSCPVLVPAAGSTIISCLWAGSLVRHSSGRVSCTACRALAHHCLRRRP